MKTQRVDTIVKFFTGYGDIGTTCRRRNTYAG